MKFKVMQAVVVGKTDDNDNVIDLVIETETGTIRAKVLESKIQTPELLAWWVVKTRDHWCRTPSRQVCYWLEKTLWLLILLQPD